jgi:hypothetical protein
MGKEKSNEKLRPIPDEHDYPVGRIDRGRDYDDRGGSAIRPEVAARSRMVGAGVAVECGAGRCRVDFRGSVERMDVAASAVEC